jgi:hypothetical protein
LRFTVHRPPCGEVSLCWYRPSGGDVAGSVHVGVERPGFAGDAREDRLALAVFGCDMPAGGASLRGVRGRNAFYASRSFLILLLLHSKVPYEPGMPAMLQQHHLLSRRRRQPEPRHTRNLATATDTNGHRTPAHVWPEESA